jgi:uncharacterized RDD family membrane protein YckC
MVNFFISAQLVGAIFTFLIGVIIAFIVRLKTKTKAENKKAAGLWARALVLGIDFALIDFLTVFLAYYGSLGVAGIISILVAVSYFFFFWTFFGATPGKMLLRMRIVSEDGGRPKMNQILRRLVLYIFFGIGWVTALFNKEKRMLHDFGAGTKVIYTKEKIAPQEKVLKILSFALLAVALICLVSLIIHGLGEKINSYKETANLKFFDLEEDGIPDGILIDSNGDGNFDVVKYDVDNDGIIDFSVYDLDGDGVAESLDINNDGRIDGFDWNGDRKIDQKDFSGYIFIYLWRGWFAFLGLVFAGLLAYAIFREKSVKNNSLR